MKKVFIFWGMLAVLCVTARILYAADNSVLVEKEANNPNEDTVVEGIARTPGGGTNEVIVKQNPNEGNPLGNPIIAPDNDAGLQSSPSVSSMPQEADETIEPPQNQQIDPIVQSEHQGELKPWQEPLPQPSDKIENELYQSGNDIIDVQAYPIKDVSTVTEPNLQPVIVTQ